MSNITIKESEKEMPDPIRDQREFFALPERDAADILLTALVSLAKENDNKNPSEYMCSGDAEAIKKWLTQFTTKTIHLPIPLDDAILDAIQRTEDEYLPLLKNYCKTKCPRYADSTCKGLPEKGDFLKAILCTALRIGLMKLLSQILEKAESIVGTVDMEVIDAETFMKEYSM